MSTAGHCRFDSGVESAKEVRSVFTIEADPLTGCFPQNSLASFLSGYPSGGDGAVSSSIRGLIQ
jgi:hypothetical protein